jgi:hypothetical protein
MVVDLLYLIDSCVSLNKKIYSASFALLTSCSGGLTLIFFVLLVDILPSRN